MSGVPDNADIIAAYLYWETVTTADIVDPIAWETEAAGVQFRGFDIDVTNVLSAKRTQVPSLGAACFGSGSLSMNMFRADVLRFLPVKVDSAGKPTGKRLVNDADLTAQGLDPHTVKLPVRDGNGVPESAGASLVVVYRDQNPNAPLKKVVIYDGNVLKPNINTAAQPDHQGLLRIGDDQVREAHAHRLQRSAEQPAEVLVQGRRRQQCHDHWNQSVHRRPGVAAVVGQPDVRCRHVYGSRKLPRGLWRDRADVDPPPAE